MEESELDLRLAVGFGFTCRPGCGLCCFTTPRVNRWDLVGIRREVPSAPLVEWEDGSVVIASRPFGGACHFLRSTRCGIRPQRPAPCRMFPITVHLGERAQASIVLSCPGVSLDRLVDGPGAPAGSLASELEAVRGQLALEGEGRMAKLKEEHRRRRAARGGEGSAEEEAERLRQRMRRWLSLVEPTSMTRTAPPPVSIGIERLPLVFSGTERPWAMATRGRRWTLLELTAEGEPPREHWATSPPDRLPSIPDEARRLWKGYLNYWIERDQLIGFVEAGFPDADEEKLGELLPSSLEEIGSTVLSRAWLLARARGSPAQSLSLSDVADGIRASDMDLLDQLSWGEQL
jgi:Fe-S-cluster containining protein